MNALVLFSGGLDSLACVAFYRASDCQVTALFVDYGQPAAKREGQAVRRLGRVLNVPVRRVRVVGVDSPPGLVPGRNAMLLNIALMSLTFRTGLVVLGVHSGTSYPDCTWSFIKRMQDIYDLYTGGEVRVVAPFLEWSKRQVWEFLAESGYPASFAYSCELGLSQPCGKCASCADLEQLHAC